MNSDSPHCSGHATLRTIGGETPSRDQALPTDEQSLTEDVDTVIIGEVPEDICGGYSRSRPVHWRTRSRVAQQ